ncbi:MULTISPECIES: hypothetical protein [unclassified Ruegeria]|uniref:COG3904 family protein n=1 Tax=unclassified Ruegeria TaxID=2625375 RepID=UPI001488FCE1|nr:MULTISPECIES: hypothetical protein [unclassified Ruegeria]
MKHIASSILAGTVGLVCFFWANPTFAQNFQVIGNGRFAEVSGPIEAYGDERFVRFLNSHPEVIGVRLNSPGGVVVSALSMAEEIFNRKLSTYVSTEHVCASACALLFFAGHDRLAEGPLGVHQIDDGGKSDASTLQFVLADQLDAFQRFDVPWTVINYMLTTPPSEMHWISENDLEELALNRDLPGDATTHSKSEPTSDVANQGYRFSDFPSKAYLSGSPSLPDFDGRDEAYRMYRTRIRDGALQGINFAGHFSMIEIGCGTSCRFAFVVDLRTGQVGDFPYGGEEQYQMKLLYSPDSTLLKVRWKGDWDRDYCTEQDLLLEGLTWKVLAERTAPTINGYCDY